MRRHTRVYRSVGLAAVGERRLVAARAVRELVLEGEAVGAVLGVVGDAPHARHAWIRVGVEGEDGVGRRRPVAPHHRVEPQRATDEGHRQKREQLVLDELPHAHALGDAPVELVCRQQRDRRGEAAPVHGERGEAEQVGEHVARGADGDTVANEAAAAGCLVVPDDEERELVRAHERGVEAGARAEAERQAARCYVGIGDVVIGVGRRTVEVERGARACRGDVPRDDGHGVSEGVEQVEHLEAGVCCGVLIVIEVHPLRADMVAGEDHHTAPRRWRRRRRHDEPMVYPQRRRAGDVVAPALVAGAPDDDGVGHVEPLVSEACGGVPRPRQSGSRESRRRGERLVVGKALLEGRAHGLAVVAVLGIGEASDEDHAPRLVGGALDPARELAAARREVVATGDHLRYRHPRWGDELEGHGELPHAVAEQVDPLRRLDAVEARRVVVRLARVGDDVDLVVGHPHQHAAYLDGEEPVNAAAGDLRWIEDHARLRCPVVPVFVRPEISRESRPPSWMVRATD